MWRPRTWIVSFVAALALIGAGVVLGEPSQVFLNAVGVCLACLGVG